MLHFHKVIIKPFLSYCRYHIISCGTSKRLIRECSFGGEAYFELEHVLCPGGFIVTFSVLLWFVQIIKNIVLLKLAEA